MLAQTIERREGHFQGHRGAELFYQTWTRPNANATLVITHGIAEHSEAYNKTAERLVSMGWDVCAWDLRGHGRSEGKRGFVEDFRFFSHDLARFVEFLKKSGHIKNAFALVGHSMGGLITLRAVVDEADALGASALCLSSPLLDFGFPVPPTKDLAARILQRLLPSVTLFNEIRYEDLSRDPEWQKIYATDPLRHDKISPAIYLGMIEGIAYVKANAGRIRVPTLVQAAGKDKVVSLPAIESFYEQVKAETKKLVIYEDSLHEIFNDLDRDRVLADLNEFLSEAISKREAP